MRRDDLLNDDITARLQRIDPAGLESGLEAQGWAVLGHLLTSSECDDIVSLYANEAGFRSHVVMARHGFGRGEYRYFSYPLPPLVQRLRTVLYPYVLWSILFLLMQLLFSSAPTRHGRQEVAELNDEQDVQEPIMADRLVR